MTTISVCIGTYGSPKWAALAQRAIASARHQATPAHEVLHLHAHTLHEARNGAAQDATGEWLCFLDADDELDEHYIEAMTLAADHVGPALLRPATLGIYPDGHTDDEPVVHPPKPLLRANFMIIGTLIRRDQFLRLGGFDDLPVFEDWELWIRAWRDGAALRAVPDAIYRVYVNTTGRNSVPQETWSKTYDEIRRRHAAR